MWRAIKMFKNAKFQTKFFIFTFALYMIALFWTTIQAYARLEYSRTEVSRPIMIQRDPSENS